MNKILDPCCGSKMFWFDKNNPNVTFCDVRELEKYEYYPHRYLEVKPDIVCDFRNLPFADETFWHIVFDPPHLERIGDKSFMKAKYGASRNT